jgi:oligoendopeptidase F
MSWDWNEFAPYYQDLAARQIDRSNVEAWLADWSALAARLDETYQRLYVSITIDTTDPQASHRYDQYLNDIYPRAQAADQVLKQKLLLSGLEPGNFSVPLKNMRAQASIFRQENLPLLSEELKLSAAYDQVIGAQTVSWQGAEFTLSQLQPYLLMPDRAVREQVWRLSASRQLADRQAINELWQKSLDIRSQLAQNANLPDYRAYRWQQLLRFDYTPQNCQEFHRAIEKVVVPAACRAYETRRQRLGVKTLRPWDLKVDLSSLPPLHPFAQVDTLSTKTAAIFHQVDPQLGAYYDLMRQENLLDLDNRKGKAPGGYCTGFSVARRPFIFMNAVGIHEDVQTLLHEGGHAFHVFETAHLPYIQQLEVGMEFGEVASMGMELLCAPYLTEQHGGFYSPRDAARARIEFLEDALLFWPYMAVVDAFQHWVYENPALARSPQNCDRQWDALWQRFMPGVDWSDLDDARITGWQRKPHIHEVPFYYIEYGLAQLGALQLWRNAMQDQHQAVAAYRQALSLGGTVPIPQLYATAGIKFAFDERTLQDAVSLIETTVTQLSQT